MIIGIDPSSTCTGYCVMNERGEIQRIGIWRSATKADIVERVRYMTVELSTLLSEHPFGRTITTAYVEMPQAGQASKLTKQWGNLAGLALYGWAAGAIWQATMSNCPNVVAVRANVWTRRKSKDKRQADLAAAYPDYADVLLAKGGDAADALGLALWGLGELKKRQARDV